MFEKQKKWKVKRMTSKAYRSLNFLKFRINGQLGEKKGAKKKKTLLESSFDTD